MFVLFLCSSLASCIEKGFPVFATVPFLKWPYGVQLIEEERSVGDSNVCF